jgi:osmotically inducible protein OsmC
MIGVEPSPWKDARPHKKRGRKNKISMATRSANALWTGTLKDGKGTMKYGAVEGPYTFASRFEEGNGTNPEELVGAAHAGCYSMFLSALISKKELTPTSVNTTATVELGKDDKGPKITSIVLKCEAVVEGLSEADFQQLVKDAKEGCPISRLYAGTEISVLATLNA